MKMKKLFSLLLCLLVQCVPQTVFALSVEICVQKPDGTQMTLEAESANRIEDIKEKIYEQTNIPAEKQILSSKKRKQTN